MKVTRVIFAILCILGFSKPVFSENFPEETITIVVGYTPGAENDILARLLAEHLTVQLKKSVIVVNKPGASGAIGAEYVARARGDGYTLLLGTTTMLGILTNLRKDLPYNPLDFEPISIVATIPTVLVVNATSSIKNVAQLVEHSRAKEKGLSYASPGAGTPFHLAGELLAMRTGANLVHVAYKGISAGVVDLLGGRIDLMFANVPAVLPLIQEGKLRVLATTNPQRLRVLPDTPTLTELGISDAESYSWFAVVAPHGTPKERVAILERELRVALSKSDVKERLRKIGADAAGTTSDEARQHIRKEIQKWGKIVRDADIRLAN